MQSHKWSSLATGRSYFSWFNAPVGSFGHLYLWNSIIAFLQFSVMNRRGEPFRVLLNSSLWNGWGLSGSKRKYSFTRTIPAGMSVCVPRSNVIPSRLLLSEPSPGFYERWMGRGSGPCVFLSSSATCKPLLSGIQLDKTHRTR